MSNKTKKVLKVIGAVAVAASLCTFAFAAGGKEVKDIIGEMLGYVRDIFISIGVLLGVFAVGQLALSFKDDNPDQKSKAMMLLVCCAILIAIGPLIKVVIDAAGASITIGSGFLGI